MLLGLPNGLILIYAISFAISFLIVFVLSTRASKSGILNRIFQQCWIKGGLDTPVTKWIQTLRGGNYYLLTVDKPKYCLLTTWGIAHILLYALIGFLYPTYFWPTLAVGIAFEVAEAYLDCHDVLDIMWNSIGFMVGAILFKLR
jgi:hypothetical protein